MSIETLLEAAKFLELQAQQQQKAREENELKENLRLEQLTERRRSNVGYTSPVHHVHQVTKAEVPCTEPHLPPPLPPHSMPITVIPFPVVTTNHTGLPLPPPTTLSPPAAPHHHPSPRRDPHSPQEHSAAPLPLSPQPKPDPSSSMVATGYKSPLAHQNHHYHPQVVAQPGCAQQPVQRYPGSIVSPPQHQALLPQPGPPQAPLTNSPNSRGSPPEDGRHLDGKKRPGGAGTREVHNKLEKNRRAHLKECFEMLKKNIPNVDEKKTSNLSVLRSALRYIQTLKRKEKEFEHEMERLAREKIATQQRLDELKNELSQWMDVVEIERVLRQTVQPEEDQASTSTASEGEDMDEDPDDETKVPTALPTVPQSIQPEQRKTLTPALTPAPVVSTAGIPLIAQHLSIQHTAPVYQPQAQPQTLTLPHQTLTLPHQTLTLPQPLSKPTAPSTLPAASSAPSSAAIQALLPTQTQMVTTAPCLQPTVIAHAPASHASVIQAVNHVIHTAGHKHIAHLAPSTTSSPVHLAAGHQQISHITVHPVGHLGQRLPALYSQSVAVTQPAMVGHIAHTLSHHAHGQLNGGMPGQPTAAIVSKQTAVGAQVVAHHPQLVGQTVLNPVTMVTMPSFPVSTLKLA